MVLALMVPVELMDTHDISCMRFLRKEIRIKVGSALTIIQDFMGLQTIP
jgi:hypothetical protein